MTNLEKANFTCNVRGKHPHPATKAVGIVQCCAEVARG